MGVCYSETRRKRIGCDGVEYTVYNLLANLMSLWLRVSQETSTGTHAVLAGNRLSKDMERFSVYRSELDRLTEQGIVISAELYQHVYEDARECLRAGDYDGVRVLVKMLENSIGDFQDRYSQMKCGGVIWQNVFPIQPLNTNYKEINTKIYPAASAAWMKNVQEGSLLDRYVVVTPEMESKEDILCIYSRKNGIQKSCSEKQGVNIAVSPIYCPGIPDFCQEPEAALPIPELIWEREQQTTAEERIVKAAEAAIKRGCDIIAFPRATVNLAVISKLQELLKFYSEKAVLLFAPSYYEGCRKKTAVFGKNGYMLYKYDYCDAKQKRILLLIDRVCGVLLPLEPQQNALRLLNTGAGMFLTEAILRIDEWLGQQECGRGCEHCSRDICYMEIELSKLHGSYRYKYRYRTA